MPIALPPEKPPPPVPMNRPFHFAVGMPIQILTLSPVGGWVVNALTRHISGLFGSTAADSIVVFGREIVNRLSHDLTGFALGISGLGGGGAGKAPNLTPPRAAAGGPTCGLGCPPLCSCPRIVAVRNSMVTEVKNNDRLFWLISPSVAVSGF